MPSGLNKYNMSIGLSHTATQIQVHQLLCRVVKGQPQAHGQWGVTFLKKERIKELKDSKKG